MLFYKLFYFFKLFKLSVLLCVASEPGLDRLPREVVLLLLGLGVYAAQFIGTVFQMLKEKIFIPEYFIVFLERMNI